MVGIGEALARRGVFAYEEEPMPKGHKLDAAAKCEIADKINHEGCDPKVVASDLGLGESTVRKIARQFRLAEEHEWEREDQMDRQKTIAGNKHDGILSRRADQANTYDGTCRLRNGKFERKRFHTVGDAKAIEMWEAWCERVREDDMPEPFAKVVAPAANDAEPVVDAIEPEAVPEIAIRPWRDVAEERQRRIDELEAQVAELENVEVPEPVATKQPTPRAGTAFLVMFTGQSPRPYGIYEDMERAIEECDRMNAALEFAGIGKLYECAEVEWR